MNNKAIAPVVTVALILIITVLATVSLQTWFSSYQSSLVSNLNSQNSAIQSNLEIEAVLDNVLYLENKLNSVDILRIEIDSIECSDTSGTFSRGIHKINISSCLSLVTSSLPTIRIITEDSVMQESVYYDASSSTSSPISSSSLINATALFGDNPINAGDGFYEFNFVEYNNNLYFNNYNSSTGVELYVYDGNEMSLVEDRSKIH